jgi:phage protein D
VKAPVLLPGLPDVRYYAPRARVEVNGHELEPEVVADLLSVSVTLEVDQLASFSLTINNWDPGAPPGPDRRRPQFKYSDSDLFDVGHSLRVYLGYADRVLPMVRGIITSLAPHFSDAGASTLSVTGQDSLVLLRDRKPAGHEARKFVGKTDGEIAEVIARRNQLVPRVDKTGEPHPIVMQRDLDDLQFLMERAKRIDFDCFIVHDPDAPPGQGDELHFRRPSDGRDAQATRVFQLEWGKNLIAFDPQITIARQVAAVTVRGWDPATKQAIVGRAGVDDLPRRGRGAGKTGPTLTRDRLRDKQDVVVDRPVHSKREADELARAILLDRAYDYLTGSARCIGQPEMRPGDNVQLAGLGRRFDGEYYVKKTTHTFGGAGYTTEFELRALHDGGLA